MATKKRESAYWCHECKRWQWCKPDIENEWYCVTCGETIMCDECGKPWTNQHQCRTKEFMDLWRKRDDNFYD